MKAVRLASAMRRAEGRQRGPVMVMLVASGKERGP